MASAWRVLQISLLSTSYRYTDIASREAAMEYHHENWDQGEYWQYLFHLTEAEVLLLCAYYLCRSLDRKNRLWPYDRIY